MNKRIVAGIFLCAVHSAYAVELFPELTPVPFTKGAPLQAASTAGGYALYKGDGSWALESLSAAEGNANGNATPIKRGTVVLRQEENDRGWFAFLRTTVNLNSASSNQYFGGSPCAGVHLVAVNKGRGRDDNCLVIDAMSSQISGNATTFLRLSITESRSGGRWLSMILDLRPDMLGFINTLPSNWQADELAHAPARKDFMARLQKLAESLQDAAYQATDFSQPQGVYDKVPSFRTLMPVPSDLADGTFPQQFLSAVQFAKTQPGYRAIAYSRFGKNRIHWQLAKEAASREVAQQRAMESCERSRPETSAACQLYDLDLHVDLVEGVLPKAPVVAFTPVAPNLNGKPSAPAKSLEVRLSELKTIFDNGLISKEEYEQKRRELLSSL